MVRGKRVVNPVDRHNRRAAAARPDLALIAEQLKRAPDSAHPLLGTRATYYRPGHTAKVEGLAEAASQALLAELLPHMTRPDMRMRVFTQPARAAMAI